MITKSINEELTQEAEITLDAFRSRLGNFPIISKAPVTLHIRNEENATVIKGIEILEKGEAFPKAPVAVEEEVTKDKKDGKKKRTAQAYSITEDPTRGFNYAKAAIS